MSTVARSAAERVIADLKAKGPPFTDEELKKLSASWDKLDVPIVYKDRAISLPADPDEMPLDKAIMALERLRKDQEQDFQVHELFDAYPHDACVAFVKALRELHGFATFETEQTFFGPEPPQMLSIRTGIHPGDVVMCPMGQLRIPGLDRPIKTQFWQRNRQSPMQFLVTGTIKKKNSKIVAELAVVTKRILQNESIYRGKPLHIRVTDNGDLDTNQPPEFLDLREITKGQLFFDEDVQDQIDTSILVPVEHAEACRQHRIQTKRTVLLSGIYGTGKSMVGRLTGRVGELNGWTYILLDKVQGLKIALEFAQRYAPAIVFAEDIERVAGVERTDEVNELINIVDGVLTKTSKVITVLTTNHIEQINQAMLRPGRLDAVIEIRAPGPETVQRIIRHYAGKLLADGEDLTAAGKELAGEIPATIAEAVSRAKLGMIGRGAETLSDRDIVVATKSMTSHLEHLRGKKKEETTAEVLARGLTGVVTDAVGKSELAQQVNDYMS